MRGALGVYRGAGIPVKDEKAELAALEMTVLGMRLDGELGLLGVGRDRRRKLESAIRALLRQKVCNGRALSAVVGHITWAFMARRPLLSVL